MIFPDQESVNSVPEGNERIVLQGILPALICFLVTGRIVVIGRKIGLEWLSGARNFEGSRHKEMSS